MIVRHKPAVKILSPGLTSAHVKKVIVGMESCASVSVCRKGLSRHDNIGTLGM